MMIGEGGLVQKPLRWLKTWIVMGDVCGKTAIGNGFPAGEC
jgi:hypothetical protein